MKYCVGLGLVMWSLLGSAAEQAEPAAAPNAEQDKPAAAASEDLSATAGPRVRTSDSADSKGTTSTAPPSGVATKGKDQPVGPDRLQLDTTIVTGNRELPKVLYIVPWKKADIGELPSQPFNSLLDEALEPVDRDEFRREVNYFGVITGKTDAQGNATGTGPAAQQQGSGAKK